ncbi:MAG: FHA domain-containing protein [Rhodoglobus sp.]
MTDLDDTVVAASRPVTATAPFEDLDDTVVGSGNAGPRERAALVDPPPAPKLPETLHYRFRIGEHSEAIALDVPAYLGRRPASPRIQTGVVPRLVVVPSPQQEVSSTHLEVRQLGASVIVTDLKSTNGSVVVVPGSAPRKLRQGESVVVSPGTLVDIGDGNIVEILPMQRLVPRAALPPQVPEVEGQS